MFFIAEGWDPVYFQNGFDSTYSWSTHKMIAEILIDRKVITSRSHFCNFLKLGKIREIT